MMMMYASSVMRECMLGVTDLGYGISETVQQMENPLQH